jgi:HSP20 family protein
MAITRWSPMGRMITPWLDMWDEDIMPSIRDFTSGGIELYETEKEVVARMNVAGVPEDKIDLTFDKGVLYVNAQVQVEEKDEKRNYYSRAASDFRYRVAIPGEIDLNQDPMAEVDNGMLTVRFAKSEKAQPRKVQIQAKAKAK